MSSSQKKYFEISSLVKGLRALELLGNHEALTVTEVARILGMNRAGSHRFLATLRELGYVEKREDKKYRLTLKVLELGMKAVNRFEIRQMARPFMQELFAVSNETVNLGWWDGKGIVHLDKIHSQEILRIDVGVGTQTPAYCTGLGKAILAHLPDEELEAYLASVELIPQVPNTITTPDRLREELHATRQRGYSIDNEELAIGLRCVAGPVFEHTGYPAYAMSIAGPAIRLTLERIQIFQEDVRRICGKLSEYLGSPRSKALGCGTENGECGRRTT
jgi:DNA-binding IclR family transcriptional regulator